MSKNKFKARIYENPKSFIGEYIDYEISTEPSVHKKLDETLDIGRINIPMTRRRKQLKMLSPVELFVTNRNKETKI